MADEEKQEEAQEQKKSGLPDKLKILFSTKNIIMVAVGLIVITIAAYFLVTKVFHPLTTKKTAKKESAQEEIKTVYMLEPIIVNIAGTNGTRYLKVTVGLELNDSLLQNEIEKRNPHILDILIRVFSSRGLDEVSEPRGRDGIRREILSRLNDILVSGRLINVYFTEFVIQ